MSIAEIIDELLKQLESPEALVRSQAALELCFWRDRQVLRPLLKALDDPDCQVRCTVASNLEELGDENAVGPLLDRLNDPDSCVVAAVIHTLELLATTDLAPVVSFLKHPSRDVRLAAVRTLGKYHPAVATLRHLLCDPDAEVRCNALWTMDHLGVKLELTSKEEEALQRLLDDSDQGLQDWAWTLIGMMFPYLLEGHERTLERMPYSPPLTLSELMKRLKASHFIDRYRAVSDLREWGSQAVEPLIEALGDVDPSVRGAAAHGLGQLGRDKVRGNRLEQAIQRLVTLLEDEGKNVRGLAIYARRELDLAKDVLGAVIYALGELGDSSIGPRLIPFLEYPLGGRIKIRRIAVDALAALRYLPAVPHIRQRLRDPEPPTRFAAMNCLFSLRHEPDVKIEETLKLILDDPVLAETANLMLRLIAEEPSTDLSALGQDTERLESSDEGEVCGNE